ncbi:MAG: hypothetical protein IPK99_05575 [Flavobacteriales bacterium]|nr:hypothetical protein [Flavobacteriales bacterium]
MITTFTLNDLIADSLLETAPDGSLTLLYRSELFGLRLDTVLNVPDTSIAYRYGLPIPGPVNFAAGTTVVSQIGTSTLDVDDVQLRTLHLRSGQLSVSLTNMVASTVISTFQLPGATYLGQPVAITQSVGPGSPLSPAVDQILRDLSSHQFDLRGPDLDQVNALSTEFNVQLDPNGNGAPVTSQDSVIAIASYLGLVPQYAEGYFGQRSIAVGPEVTDVDVFAGITSGVLDLEQVTARIKVINGIGVDGRIRINALTSINTSTGVSVPLTHTIVGDPINLNRAQDLGGSFQPSVWQTTLDGGNSNIDVFVENLPNQLNYEAELEVNPLGDISNGHDFLYYESALSAQLEVEIPLRLIATDLTLENVVRPELPGSAEGHALLNGDLRLFATNGFPFSAELRMDLVDPDGVVLNSIPVTGLVEAGVVGSNGLVHTPILSRCDAVLTESQVDLLYADARIRLRAVFNTADQTQHLPLLASYKMDLQVTTGTHYLVNGDE